MKVITIISLILLSHSGISQTKESDNLFLLELFQNQRYMEASDFLKKIHPEPIRDKKILSRFGYSLQMAGRLSEAESYYNRILEQDSSDISVLFSLANINQRKGNYFKATNYYKSILLIDSLNFLVFRQLSYMIEASEGVLFAAPYLARANQLNPADGDIAYSFSKVLKSAKQYKMADSILSVALAADTSNLILLKGKAELAYATNNWPLVIETINKLIAQGDQSALLLKMLGEAYYLTEKYTMAIELLEGMEQNLQQSESTLYFIAMSYKALKNYPKAIEYLNKTLTESISPNVAEYYALIGDSNQKNNQLRASLAAYQKSLFYESKPLTLYSMAVIYDQNLKDSKTALSYYKRYIKTNPPPDHKAYIEYSNYRIAELSR